jgi:asparagine synthase (glutamine-hydrolysing)
LGLIPQAPLPPAVIADAVPENQLSWFELTHYLRNTLLRDGDAMSMNSGLELRTPFLDHPLVELVLGLSAEEKWGLGGQNLKHLLHRTYGAKLPPVLFKRKKKGFFLPYGRWINGELRQQVDSSVQGLRATSILPKEHLDRVDKQARTRSADWVARYQVLVLHEWLCANNVIREGC